VAHPLARRASQAAERRVDDYKRAQTELSWKQVEAEEVKRDIRNAAPLEKTFEDLCDYCVEKRAPRRPTCGPMREPRDTQLEFLLFKECSLFAIAPMCRLRWTHWTGDRFGRSTAWDPAEVLALLVAWICERVVG
jgi:hypothetical protein